ncbi:MAG: aldo/keto reductase [Candidatus Tectomicrobia bacterium]|uniref:Aldo/keto reductase n=1 Tax=Tectimicrobiota bacterium TaxID=2528274 RepID=A0A932I1F9_UNCTE|nr:aldo/keto reductase [Candidatus Tectomicrobia bacterium]
MRYRVLGRTGLSVSSVGMGTLESFDVPPGPEEDRCRRLVDEALARGCNFFDTAPAYGASERVLGLALAGRRAGVLLATKVRETSAPAARASIERSFERLRTDVIDLLQVHNMAGWREVLPVLEEYRERGRVRFLGLTYYERESEAEALAGMRTGRFDAVQVPFWLGETSCRERVLPLAAGMNLGVIAMRPIARAWRELARRRGRSGPWARLRYALSRAGYGSFHPLGKKEARALAALEAGTLAQALIRYVLSDPRVSTVVPATRRPGRAAENAAAGDMGPLPPEAARELEKLLG